MIKLLIADDEPLICIGIQSLLNWEALGITIIGTARNGKEAYDIIAREKPEIVIADIKMPLKDGLQLAEECRQNIGRIPLFIILTSYEDFSYARKALNVRAIDYLTKIDLTAETLTDAILRAKETLNTLRVPADYSMQHSSQQLRERFFLRLFNNLFDSSEQIVLQQQELGIRLSGYTFRVAYCSLERQTGTEIRSNIPCATYNNIIQALHETLAKKHTCYIIPLDLQNFIILFCLDSSPDQAAPGETDTPQLLTKILNSTFKSVYNYFSIHTWAGVSGDIQTPEQLSQGYWSAQRAHRFTDAETALVFADSISEKDTPEESYFYKMRGEIRKAFEELDVGALHDILTALAESFRQRSTSRLQALNASCNILYMAISLLPDGEHTVSEIFSGEPESYCCIYHLTSVEDIAKWLLQLRDGCCETIRSKQNNYQSVLVAEVQKYIRANLAGRLSLNEVAAYFNFSPNYLSKIFSQYAGVRLMDYIAHERIQEAKRLMADGSKHIYEVAGLVGFENAFYFSTVFKKIEGVSPRNYINRGGNRT